MKENLEISFNGIDASTGRYLIEPCAVELLHELSRRDVATSMRHEAVDAHDERRRGLMRPVAGIDERNLEETGWGVVFPWRQDPAIKEALSSLLEWRRRQAGEHYLELIYEGSKTELQFLADHGKGPGPVDPAIIPYYLLLVGGPAQISFDFQYQLAVEFAVGRLDLETPADYERYAEVVVHAEKRRGAERRAIFFGVSNPDDNATAVSQKHLIKPLADDFERRASIEGWKIERVYDRQATKGRLRKILESPNTSGSFLFTASHGVGFTRDAILQRARQGAILCADWPGPRKWRGGVPEDFYFSANDLSDQVSVDGSIVMAFACYSAGTPQMDSFYHREGYRSRIAPSDFIARLPQRLLARGALAFIGHIDRAWTFSFLWPQAKAQRAVFESTLVSLLQGQPIGAAMDYFGIRHATLAALLIQRKTRGRRVSTLRDPLSLPSLWTAYYDAKSYVILGDPAVRFPESEPA